jgi:hypothetical protein
MNVTIRFETRTTPIGPGTAQNWIRFSLTCVCRKKSSWRYSYKWEREFGLQVSLILKILFCLCFNIKVHVCVCIRGPQHLTSSGLKPYLRHCCQFTDMNHFTHRQSLTSGYKKFSSFQISRTENPKEMKEGSVISWNTRESYIYFILFRTLIINLSDDISIYGMKL